VLHLKSITYNMH